MRLGLLKEIDWDYVGAILAHSDDDAQAAFLKAFVKECLSWGTKYQVQVQMSCINSKLTEKEIDVLSMITYKEDDT